MFSSRSLLTLLPTLGLLLACGGMGGGGPKDFKPNVVPNVDWLKTHGVTTIVSAGSDSAGLMVWLPGGHTGEDGQTGRMLSLKYPAKKLDEAIGRVTHMCTNAPVLEASIDALIKAHDNLRTYRKDDDRPTKIDWVVYRKEPRAEVARITLVLVNGCTVKTTFY